jgi:hypothetical protein
MVMGIHGKSFPWSDVRVPSSIYELDARDKIDPLEETGIRPRIQNLWRRHSVPEDTGATCASLMKRVGAEAPRDFRVLTGEEQPWLQRLACPFFSKGDTERQDPCKYELLVNETDLPDALIATAAAAPSEERDRAEAALAESVRQATLIGWKPESIDIFHAALKLLARHKMRPAFETLVQAFLPGDRLTDLRRGVRSYIAHSLYTEKHFTAFDSIVDELVKEAPESVEALFTNLLHTILPQEVAPFRQITHLLARFKKACPCVWEEQTRQLIAMNDHLPPGFLTTFQETLPFVKEKA